MKKQTLLQLAVANWKTTVTGVAIIATAVCTATHLLTPAQAISLLAGLSGAGFTFSKDADNATGAQQVVQTELEVAEAALDAAKISGNEKLIALAQASVDALTKGNDRVYAYPTPLPPEPPASTATV